MLIEFFRWWSPGFGRDWPRGDTREQAVHNLCAFIDHLKQSSPYDDPVARAVVRTILFSSERSSRFYQTMISAMHANYPWMCDVIE